MLRAAGQAPVLGRLRRRRPTTTAPCGCAAAPPAPELWVEAFLGGAVLAPRRGARAARRARRRRRGRRRRRARPARALGRRGRSASAQARVAAPYQVGWCSWYHYFHDVTEADLRANLAPRRRLALRRVPARRRLPVGHRRLADDQRQVPVRRSTPSPRPSPPPGRRPGLWIAPFLVRARLAGRRRAPRLARPRPPNGRAAASACSTRRGVAARRVHVRPRHHQPRGARPPRVAWPAALVDAGFTYLKLDFTFAPSFDGVLGRPGPHPGRSGCGPATTPSAAAPATTRSCSGAACRSANVVGVVDGNRIGPDVAPSWDAGRPRDRPRPATSGAQPATVHAWQQHAEPGRFMHRRLWLNDPDCLMLRTERDRS